MLLTGGQRPNSQTAHRVLLTPTCFFFFFSTTRALTQPGLYLGALFCRGADSSCAPDIKWQSAACFNPKRKQQTKITKYKNWITQKSMLFYFSATVLSFIYTGVCGFHHKWQKSLAFIGILQGMRGNPSDIYIVQTPIPMLVSVSDEKYSQVKKSRHCRQCQWYWLLASVVSAQWFLIQDRAALPHCEI